MALQNLDERIARKARYGQTFYSGETAGPGYYWQPDTLVYVDTTTSKEVTIISPYPNNVEIFSKEHGTQNPWGYNGNWIGFFQHTTNLRTTNAERSLGSSRGRIMIKSDGTKLRICEGRGRAEWPNDGFSMSPWANTYYTWDSSTSLYRGTYDNDTGVITTSSSLISVASEGGSELEIARNGIWPTRIVSVDNATMKHTWSPTPPKNVSCEGVYIIDNLLTSPVLTYNWSLGRNEGGGYDSHSANECTYFQHAGIYSFGPNGTMLMGNWENEDSFSVYLDHGTASDGGPKWNNWDGDSFGSPEEIWVTGTGGATYGPYDYRSAYGGNTGYFGHPALDRWGRYTLYGYGESDTPGVNGCYLFDWTTKRTVPTIGTPIIGGKQLTYDPYHHGWQGFTDYVIGCPYDDNNKYGSEIWMNKYNSTWNGTPSEVQLVTALFNSFPDSYNVHPRPVQSPDGTKVLFSHTILGSDPNVHLAYVTALYPYPPEIYQATATGGTVSIRFDWGTNSGTWRGNTIRKWPTDAGSYLPPRETKLFRLWRSANGTTWTPIKIINATIWDKYDFVNGGYKGGQTAYWTFTDTPGNGTFYYAVTSMEWSGLESRALSNIYTIVVSGGSGTGSQSTVYPASPGGDSNFYNSFSESQPTLIRHYNIYALDGSAPTAIQQRRINSVAHTQWTGATATFRDWLGKTDQTTQYKVTAVDTQGNESSTSYVTSQTKTWVTSGQYTLTWDQMYEAPTEQGEEEEPPTSNPSGYLSAEPFPIGPIHQRQNVRKIHPKY